MVPCLSGCGLQTRSSGHPRLVPSRSLRPSARFCKPPNMQMRRAMVDDGAMIARLHTESWRSAYKPFLNPNFLSGPIEEDRLRAWTSRLMRRPANETVIVAEIENEPIGFVCAVGGEDDRWGTLIDNLHVLPSAKGQGVGAALLGAAAEWSAAIYPSAGIYLWCFEQNAPACRFYEQRGGVAVEQIIDEAPGGGLLPALRFHWPDPASAFDARKVCLRD